MKNNFIAVLFSTTLFGAYPAKALDINIWNGSMLDSDLNNTLTLRGESRSESLYGIGLNRELISKGPIDLSAEVSVFQHNKYDKPSQIFHEGVTAFKLTYVTPRVNFSILEGLSYNSEHSYYEKTTKYGNGKSSQLLNYLALEIEVPVDKSYSFLGRIHHRSGAYGFFNGVHGGSNGCLLGFKYKIL
tara:strand:- start:115 stop:675 length:561 start_codon:yes stop_codon:yes gene_type:complete